MVLVNQAGELEEEVNKNYSVLQAMGTVVLVILEFSNIHYQSAHYRFYFYVIDYLSK